MIPWNVKAWGSSSSESLSALGIDALFGSSAILRYQPKDPRTQASVVQRADNSIYRINHYPVDSVLCFLLIILSAE